ncbi:Ig domain-containing protein [Candidatus Saccharibacteria bacterium]|nr:Ig domain-containing protein [Candidatus Saccharibacteria bacterium]
MKNKLPTILAVLAIILTLMLAITPKAYVFAGGDACSIAGNSDPLLCGSQHSDEELELMKRVKDVLHVVFTAIGIIAVVVIIIAGIRLMLSKGEAQKISQAKMAIFYSISGLVVTFCAFAFTDLVIGAIYGQLPGETVATTPDKNRNEVKAISLMRKIAMTVGQTLQINPRVIPDYATDQSLSYKSKNASIANVNNAGEVTAVKKGETDIVVSSKNGVKNQTTIVVYDKTLAERIVVSPTTVSLPVGRTVQATATVFPTNATDKTLKWTSANEKIAKVNIGGLISAIAPGDTIITVKTKNDNASQPGVQGIIKVHVESPDKGYVANPYNPDDGGNTGSGKETTGATTNVKYSGWLDFREETRQIVKKNMDGINWQNHDSFLKSHGGYANYINSLGGVFSKFGGKDEKIPIKTAADLQEAAEYFFGIFSIYGSDYSAGGRWPVWGEDHNSHGVAKKGTPDGFYYGYEDRKYRKSKDSKPCGRHVQMAIDFEFGKGYKGESCIKKRIRGNCNYSQDSFIRQTNLKLPSSSNSWTSKSTYHNSSKIKHTNELQVGDWVHYYSGGEWKHIAIVGEVYQDIVVLYDGGGRFNRSMHYKKIMYRNTDSLKGTEYDNYSKWDAVRLWDIDQNVTLKGINDKPKNWIW